jgi:hypothetical protein
VRLLPHDINTLATAVLDSLIISVDKYAREASPSYWMLGRPWIDSVVKAIRDSGDREVIEIARRVSDVPADQSIYNAARELLIVKASGQAQATVRPIFEAAWQVQCNGRLGYHLGSQYFAGEQVVDLDSLTLLDPGPERDPSADPYVLVVVPFGDHTPGWRVRNILACLLALRDQSFARLHYQVSVVETASEPRWQTEFSKYADHYWYAYKPKAAESDSFNKSWAVNVGVINTPCDPEVICLLDADILVDRDFLIRNTRRFLRPGVGALLPYRDALYLDSASSNRAIRERIEQGRDCANLTNLRGFLLRRPPGGCVWVRSEVFHRIGGMDEGFEDWGGDDNNLVYRLDLETPLDSYDDALLHLYHPSSSRFAADDADAAWDDFSAELLTWRLADEIGRIDRFASEVGDPVRRAPRRSARRPLVP